MIFIDPARSPRGLAPVLAALLLGACAAAPRSPQPAPAAPPAALPAPAPAPAQPSAPPPAPRLARSAARDVHPPLRVRISAVGDVMLGGSAQAYLARSGYAHAFAAVRGEFLASQLVIANLEGPLTVAETPFVDKRYVFRSPPEPVSAALAGAGIDAVSLANNHTLDFGMQGLRETIAALAGAGIRWFGAGEDLSAARAGVILDAGATRIGLLGYSNTFPEAFWAGDGNGGTAFGHEAQVREDVARLAAQADLVVVSFHWGREGTTELRPYQPQLAYAAIDAGAVAVIGHHPHILQAVEHYRGGVILYSLGNFAFGSFSKAARDSAIAHLDFENGRLREASLVPINVDNFEVYFQPRLLPAPRAAALYATLARLSLERGTGLAWRGAQIVTFPLPPSAGAD